MFITIAEDELNCLAILNGDILIWQKTIKVKTEDYTRVDNINIIKNGE